MNAEWNVSLSVYSKYPYGVMGYYSIIIKITVSFENYHSTIKSSFPVKKKKSSMFYLVIPNYPVVILLSPQFCVFQNVLDLDSYSR